MKKTITTLGLAILIGSSFGSAFAQTTTTPTPGSNNRETRNQMKKVDPVCLQNAVEKRETSLISALTAQHGAVITAHTVRKDSVKAALLLPTKKEVNDARNLANKNFETSVKKAKSEMKTVREAVWPTFRADMKACGHIEMERATVTEMSL
jgi:hypothetical protein